MARLIPLDERVGVCEAFLDMVGSVGDRYARVKDGALSKWGVGSV